MTSFRREANDFSGVTACQHISKASLFHQSVTLCIALFCVFWTPSTPVGTKSLWDPACVSDPQEEQVFRLGLARRLYLGFCWSHSLHTSLYILILNWKQESLMLTEHFVLLRHSSGIAGYEHPFKFCWGHSSKTSAGFKWHELLPSA